MFSDADDLVETEFSTTVEARKAAALAESEQGSELFGGFGTGTPAEPSAQFLKKVFLSHTGENQ